METLNNFLPLEIARKTVLVTTTFYKKFDPSNTDPHNIDCVRGELALQTLELAKLQGMLISVVDDGSSKSFRNSMEKIGVDFLEGGKGMGEGRRMAFKHASQLPDADYLLWTEPEKSPLLRYCLPKFIEPLVYSKADAVIATRDKLSFGTYPAYQIKTEKEANRLMSQLLKKHKLWPEYVDDLDLMFAPRFYLNNETNLSYLTDKFENINTLRSKGKPSEIDFDRWPSSIIFPVVRALYDSKISGHQKVAVVEVPYRHPKEQAESEIDSPLLTQKRWDQYVHLIYSLERMIMYLEGNPRSGIIKV